MQEEPPGSRKLETCNMEMLVPKILRLDETFGSVLFPMILFFTKDSTCPISSDPKRVS